MAEASDKLRSEADATEAEARANIESAEEAAKEAQASADAAAAAKKARLEAADAAAAAAPSAEAAPSVDAAPSVEAAPSVDRSVELEGKPARAPLGRCRWASERRCDWEGAPVARSTQ